ncbi:dicarboxylate carrier SLC25A8-like isoform X2 [Oppia nitens]|nr:dicarboxylate carrier SLC25A8-like isoform X2 [Oppia nitens]
MQNCGQTGLIEKMLCAGSAACMADIATFPLDVAKVRLQIQSSSVSKIASNVLTLQANGLAAHQYSGLFGTLIGMARNEGIGALYGGIGPGLQRQCVFASLRIGLYEPVKDIYTRKLNLGENAASIMTIRIISGITTGAIAITVAQPTDLVKVRMQAQSRQTGGRPVYNNSIHAYKTIYASEGLKGLWKGLGPNILRNSVVNAAELVCYDTIKELLLNYGIFRDGLPCHFSAAFTAGFCATLVSSPIDVVKTRYMNSTGQYSSVIHCAKTLAKQGGFSAFYKGFTPSFMRLGSWNVCMFVTFEQLKRLSNNWKSERQSKSSNKSSLVVLTKPATL